MVLLTHAQIIARKVFGMLVLVVVVMTTVVGGGGG